MDSVSDILEHFCVIHLSVLSLILTLYVIIILESSYLCQIKKMEHSNKYLSSLQLGFGEIMIYKTLANIISVCLSPFPHFTFLSRSPFFFFFGYNSLHFIKKVSQYWKITHDQTFTEASDAFYWHKITTSSPD